MAKRVKEQAPGQMSTDDFKDIKRLHKVDCEYYHKDCDGAMEATYGHIETSNSSMCPLCGLFVTTSLQSCSVTKLRINGAPSE